MLSNIKKTVSRDKVALSQFIYKHIIEYNNILCYKL